MILDITNATVTYPDGDSRITALDHADLHVDSGELAIIVGESGSGKSTLLAVAGGLTVPDSGTVSIAGKLIDGSTDAFRTTIRRDYIGFIFQTPGLISSLSVRDQLLLTDHMRGVRGRALRQRRAHADELLDRVGLAAMADRRITELSGGQRQRVGIARALMGDPKLLLADEPTSALDRDTSHATLRLIRDLVDDFDLACALITHDRSLLTYADTVVEVADGRAVSTSAVHTMG